MVSAANRYPIVAVGASGRMRIVTGHHRTFAALVQGRLLLARLAAVDRSVDRVTAVTPLIRLLRERAGSDAERAIDFLEGARGTLVRSEDEAENALTQLGLDEEQVADRLHMATTGRVLGGR
jgi:hypothetical protein